MPVRIIAVSMIAVIAAIVAWYLAFRHYHRRQASRLSTGIERAFQGHAELAAIQWRGASRFSVRLRLTPTLFRDALISVRLFPRPIPVAWLCARLRKQQETLTFQADLDVAPSFNLEVHNHRWLGRTRRRRPDKSREWSLEQVGPFVLTTRADWQRDITSMMGALVASRECDCLTVCFRRTSPHFAVTVPLEALSPAADTQGSNFFDLLRELAAGAASARF